MGADDVIIATLYNTGVRVGEHVALDVDHLRDELVQRGRSTT